MKNKTVIGFIHGHNSSASLIIDGVIKESISEERFDRIKNSTNFPIQSINYLIKKNKLNKKKIIFYHASYIIPFSDRVNIKNYDKFISKKEKSYFIKIFEGFLYNIIFKSDALSQFLKFIYHKKNTKHNNNIYINNQKKIISNKINIDMNQIYFLDHHQIHFQLIEQMIKLEQ